MEKGNENKGNILYVLNTLKKYQVTRCYYGHLHGGAHKEAMEGNIQGINFQLISGDYVHFNLVKISWNFCEKGCKRKERNIE